MKLFELFDATGVRDSELPHHRQRQGHVQRASQRFVTGTDAHGTQTLRRDDVEMGDAEKSVMKIGDTPKIAMFDEENQNSP